MFFTGRIKTAVIAAMFMAYTSFAFAEFTPWGSDVLTGDELIQSRGYKGSQGVYNGAQGGAFFLIRFFQVFISTQDGPNCRHVPTCSAYGREAVLKHGALAGSILAGERILRCNPFYPPSKDPVPDTIIQK